MTSHLRLQDTGLRQCIDQRHLTALIISLMIIVGCDDQTPLAESLLDQGAVMSDRGVSISDQGTADMNESNDGDQGLSQRLLRPRFSLDGDDFYDTP